MLTRKIAQIIYDKKGFNIIAMDVKNLCSMADYLIIAEGSVERHIRAIADEIIEEIEDDPLQIEGLKGSDWIVINYPNVLVHLFKPELRQKYSLEKLWNMGQIIDLKIKLKEDHE